MIIRTPLRSVSLRGFREAKILAAPRGGGHAVGGQCRCLPRTTRRELERARRKLARRACQRPALGSSTSDIDHRTTLNNQSITWTNGLGVHVTYSQVEGSTPPPVNAYETITTVSTSSGVPTSLLERDLDGTTRRLEVFKLTSVLRLALLTDKNGNTVEYQRDALGRLTHVSDVRDRFFNLTYNPAGLVATLTYSGGRKKLGPLSGSLIYSPARAPQSWSMSSHIAIFHTDSVTLCESGAGAAGTSSDKAVLAGLKTSQADDLSALLVSAGYLPRRRSSFYPMTRAPD